MRLRNKILLGVIIVACIIASIGIGVSYYLMSLYPALGDAFENNPFAALEATSRIIINQVTSTPAKNFNIEDMDRDYWMTAEEAKEYGLIDDVFEMRL